MLGAAADAFGRELVFSSVAVVGAALAVWAVRTPAAAPERAPRLRELASATADRRIAMGMWLVALPGLLFGTLGVLAPLQLDDFGAAAAAIAAVFVAAGLLEAAVNPVIGRVADRRGRVGPAMFGLGSAAVVFALLALAQTGWVLAALVILAAPAVGILWTPAMTLMSDGAEALGLEQGFAFALLNLAWSMGETAGASGGSRLAEAFGDGLPYALLATLCSVTLALFARSVRRRTAPTAGVAS